MYFQKIRRALRCNHYTMLLSLSLCYHTTCVVSVSLYYLFRTIGLCVSRLIFHLVFFSLSAKKNKSKCFISSSIPEHPPFPINAIYRSQSIHGTISENDVLAHMKRDKKKYCDDVSRDWYKRKKIENDSTRFRILYISRNIIQFLAR